MVINSQSVVGVPSRQLAEVPSRQVAAAPRRPDGFGPCAAVRERGLAVPVADGGYLPGIWTGGGNDAAGYLPGSGGAFKRGPLAGIQAGFATNSTVDNSNDQHNTIKMARLVPASRGEVGPHRVREPGPA